MRSDPLTPAEIRSQQATIFAAAQGLSTTELGEVIADILIERASSVAPIQDYQI